uniref:Pituitary-specific positive transcription factor 1 n=1 Tax=Eptatretus burgeri TaxID=7764 RepID=A0A8C4NJE9_EPTBU
MWKDNQTEDNFHSFHNACKKCLLPLATHKTSIPLLFSSSFIPLIFIPLSQCHCHPENILNQLQFFFSSNNDVSYHTCLGTAGYTQTGVGAALANVQGSPLSQTTVCRFENLQLSLRNACRLRDLLICFFFNSFVCLKKKKNSHYFLSNSIQAKHTLEATFLRQARPPPAHLQALAVSLGLPHHVVRVWFCNRRQREKRVHSQPSLPETA